MIQRGLDRRLAQVLDVLRATWWIEREGKRRATLAIRPFGVLAANDREEVAEEARRLIDFAAADAATRDVRFEAAVP